VKDRKSILEDFKAIYNKDTKEEALAQYEVFKTTWSRYPSVLKSAR
jgi:Transposase, Mutator family.